MLTEVFLSFAISSFIACFLTLSRQIYKSKCKNFSFCGINIERDTEAEEHIDKLELETKKGEKKEDNNI
jgi:hypothetical protein